MAAGAGRRRGWWIAAGTACAVAIVAVVHLVAAGRARNEVRAAAQAQLRIIALDLESALDKFDTLPYALALQPAVGKVLLQPEDDASVRQLNRMLQSVQRHAKVAAIYLMDRTGKTIAASNWGQNGGFNYLGKNFGFRPYFRNAMAGSPGRFYGIGSTTSEPGYFIAQPVYPATAPAAPGGLAALPAQPMGVMAVKISLDEFERTWGSSQDPIALADRSGVIFLSNRIAWKYHSLTPLDAAARLELSATQQYLGQSISPLPQASGVAGAGEGAAAGAGTSAAGTTAAHPVGRLGWQLLLFAPEARITRIANLSALAATLLLTVAAISLLAVSQRRRRLREGLASRAALREAADALEQTIARRTRELRLANDELETRYRTLQQTEEVLRSTQNELVQAGKLAMLGQMAAGVTHELNQPLAAIRAFADNAVTFLARGQSEPARENLNHISAASARMGTIIGQLKGFARKSGETVATVDLSQSIHASAFLLEGEFRRHAVELKIEIDAAGGAPLQVLGDAGRIEQVLINLLKNALDALDPTQAATAAAGHDGAPDPSVERHAEVQDPGQATSHPPAIVRMQLRREAGDAVITIHDAGPGLAAHAVDRLFEPFFTTKASGKGLGLGLAISSSIVQAMNGQLSGRNHPDGGAEFTLRLPLAAPGHPHTIT